MPGRLDEKMLATLIRKGDIDTVLTVFPDGLGRLMGKRLVARHFLDHALEEGVHACIYLFTVDMEMEPLPGFTLTSWERGYGDMKMVPDLGTLRLIPWLPKTALVLCDVYTEEGEPVEEAPRWVLKRQVERAARMGYVVKAAAELELYCFRESFEAAQAKRYGNAYEDATLPQVPKTLREAIAELERSKIARAAFGDRVIDHYLHAARLEQEAFDRIVTDWELVRHFERI